MPVPSNTQLASYKVAYRAGQCKKPHTVDGELILPSTIDMVSTMIDKAIASKGYSFVRQHYQGSTFLTCQKM